MGLLSVPLKTILPYHADLQNETIPETYALCDGSTLTSAQQDIVPAGTYTVPDLRNVFLLGADVTKAPGNAGGTTNAASDAPGPKGTGGQHSKSLSVTELPSHNHTGSLSTSGLHNHSGSFTDSAGDHNHTASAQNAGAHIHAGSTTSTTGSHTHGGSSTTVAGQHNHTVTDPGHSHAIYIYQHTYGSGPNNTQDFASVPLYDNGVRTQSSSTGISLVVNGDHSHNLNISADGSHSHTITLVADGDHTHNITINNAGGHIHSFTLVGDGAHTHIFSGGNTGSSQAFDTRPRYYGVVYIIKVKV